MKLIGRINYILLLLTGCLVALALSQGPYLTISPKLPQLNFPANENRSILCRGQDSENDDNSFTDMKWIHSKGIIHTESAGIIIQKFPSNSLRLTFIAPQTGDNSGYYNCTALYRDTQPLEASVYVRFYENVAFKECEKQQSVVSGEPGRILCRASGNPKPTITWEKDGQELSATDRITITENGVDISRVERDDGGKYRVEAYVPDTGVNEVQEISVSVQIKPKIIDLVPEVSAIEGEQYKISCTANGVPKPIYTWYNPNRKDLSQMDGYSVNQDDGSLTINRVERTAKGNYTCRVMNDAGSDEKGVMLIVLVKPVIQQFESITAKVSDLAALECRAHGDPLPDITIRRDNSHDRFDENQDNRVELITSIEEGQKVLRLRVATVKREDDGLYFCAANNDAGRDDKQAHFQVQFPPNMSLTPSLSVKAWAGSPINLTCIAEASPNATLSWLFRENVIETGKSEYYKVYGRTTKSNLWIDIREEINQDVFGIYTCEAVNDHGKNSVNIELSRATAPGPLSQVLFDRVTSTTITFRFLGPSNDGGLPITGYVLKYWRHDEPEDAAARIDWPTNSSYILNKLTPRMKYKFLVAAKNIAGIGDFVRSNYTMPQESAPEPPTFKTQMETVSDYQDRFELRWEIPDNNGKPIESFEIRYYKVEREINGWKQINKASVVKVENWDNAAFELINLTPSTWYKVELRAFNSKGDSFPGELIFRTRTGPVGATPTSRVSSTSLTLPVIIAIAVAALLILLILMDVACYVRFHCGLLYLMRYRTCGRESNSDKVKDIPVDETKQCMKRKDTRNGDDIMYRSYPFEDTPMVS